jgi:glycosyltransferase involved in cell wall biosynthesis
VLGRSDFLVGRSNEAIEIARRKGYSGPAEFVPNGVDPALFRPLDRAESRAQVFGPELRNAFIAGYVGRFVPEKGLSEMLEALPLAPAQTHLVFVGDGPCARS